MKYLCSVYVRCWMMHLYWEHSGAPLLLCCSGDTINHHKLARSRGQWRVDCRKSLAVSFSSEKDNFSSDAQSFYHHKTVVSFIHCSSTKVELKMQSEVLLLLGKIRLFSWKSKLISPALSTRNQFVYSRSVHHSGYLWPEVHNGNISCSAVPLSYHGSVH